jgi:hypothetical protein
MNFSTVGRPPFVTEETTIRRLHAALVELQTWSKTIEACLDPAVLASVDKQMPPADVPEYDLLVAATSVWQQYRTIRSVRAVRIAYDWATREFDNHPSLNQQMIRLLMSVRSVLRFACTTPSEFRANAATQGQRMQNFINGVFGAGGQGQQQQGE